MADMFNFNTGDSNSAGYNNSQYPKSVDVQSAQNVEYQHNWLRTPRPFGLNVRVPETPQFIGENTEALIKRTAKELFLAPIKEITNFFEKYEKVFSGEVANELKSLYVQRFNTATLLQSEDEEVFGTSAPKFMMDM